MSKLKGKPKFEKQIRHMDIGEKGYIVPWAISFGIDGKVWLNISFNPSKSKGGTVDTKIKRLGVNDYEVDIRGSDNKWSVGKSSYVGGSDNDLIHIDTIGFDNI